MHWTKKLSKEKRDRLAKTVRGQREEQLRGWRLTYSAARRLSSVPFIEDIVGEKQQALGRPLRFLDSGAGLMGVSADLKRAFGKDIEVTAITLRHPNLSTKSKRRSLKTARTRAHAEYYPFNGPESERQKFNADIANQISSAIDRGRRDVNWVDSQKIGLVENLSARKKYDIIFDGAGALQYGLNNKRILERYYKMLPQGGLLVLNIHPYTFEKIKELIDPDKFILERKEKIIILIKK